MSHKELVEDIDNIKSEYAQLGIVMDKEIQDVFEDEIVTSEIEKLEKEYINTDNKVQNLIKSSIYKSLKRNYNGALSDLDLAIKADPYNFLAYFCRANVRSEMIDYMKMLEQESEVILIDPTGNSQTGSTIKSYENIQDYNVVIQDYMKTLQLAPEFVFAAYNLANTYVKTRDYKKAVDLYNAVVKLEPIFAEAFYNRGLTYIYLKQNENGCMDMSVSGELGLKKAYSVIARFCEN